MEEGCLAADPPMPALAANCRVNDTFELGNLCRRAGPEGCWAA